MCSHPEFDDEMLPLSKGDALEGATLREGDICGRTAIPPNARNTQNIAAEYILNKTTSIRIGRRGCSTTNINIRNETSFYHTKLSPAQPLLSANLQRQIHRRVAVGHEAQQQLAEPAALEPERARLRRQGHHRSLYAAHSKN